MIKNFNALRYDLDTTALEDGTHSVTSGSKTVSFVSDNTAPVIETNMVEGQIYLMELLKVVPKMLFVIRVL